ncbi:MAG: threonine--tRNA ligase [Gemmatimonadetes bacterium]|uniref:Threonine--tRNA ligase n=1 Tax=Candidatus Kutchimonas denitrificans TaxID=3056748 RepID=A0AAE4Z910_9BACT|nr:threonine--tRNA ligase [Gemmatimonadota bacterium]NIR76044.1 threonine--tRNA ligase [Candidatus Kutchimonas denitrificans]NIS02236.1 threonine--tRNA ligase [Gemmatimonadota bacterium]NIT68062.1 threonine--tRNA ligase [Gemmatimonadota bacterium]NIU54088.1 threonine--tRNA ligase [Gemmatimonadota bacterium]
MSAAKLKLELSDGKQVEVEHGISPHDLAQRVNGELADRAIAAKLDGEIVDLDRPLERSGRIEFLFEDDEDQDSLYVLRHSTAHVLATAVRSIWPDAGIGFGPPIADGFYYDFDVDSPFTPEDLEKIEERMKEVVAADEPFERREVERQEARELFSDDPYKLERLEEIPEGETISIYRDGAFVDLCRGPHLPSTGAVKHFKILHSAGAYWRGDERRAMLQRIYGTAFFEKKDLEEHLRRLEEARKRDHRIIGKQLDLFSIQDDVGPGLIQWHPKGAMIQFLLRRFLEDELLKRGYDFVYSPHIAREALFRRSGHLQAYSEVMFPAMESEGEKDNYRLKPMNCPFHMSIYASGQRSYRDLPVRYAEIASDYRNEKSGTLHGMLRVRGLTMDDAHIFCRPDQVEDEIYGMLDLVANIYGTFGLEYRLDFATRPAKRIGSDQVWDEAEDALRAAIERRGLTYAVDPGGGAFYGPKIDVKFVDAIGREWQGATIQLDFVLPERFDLNFVGSDNQKHRPVMIHRAIYGSFERFIGVLIEHFAGAFPLWLAPVQVRLIPVTDDFIDAAREVAVALREAGVRVELDDRSETVSYRIRDGELQKIPYLGVIGQREADAGTVAVRKRGAEKKQVVLPLAEFIEQVTAENRTRALG